MKELLTSRRTGKRLALAAGMLLGAAMAMADGIDPSLAGWLGREITIETSSFNDHIPVGGKLTFVYDSSDDVVRVCTRSVATQRGPWRMDLAAGCNVTLTFTRGERYCTIEDVKAGNGEVLSGCHRLRSRDVALEAVDHAGRDRTAGHDRVPGARPSGANTPLPSWSTRPRG